MTVPERPTIRGSGAQVGRLVWEQHGKGTPQWILNDVCQTYKMIMTSEHLPRGGSGGLWCTDDGQYVITVNADESPARQTFSKLHEVGHYFMHADLDLTVDRYDQNAVTEREADEFAAEIALPLEEAWDLHSLLSVDSERDMADCSNVDHVVAERNISRSAVQTRLRVLERCNWTVQPRDIVISHPQGMFIDRSLREPLEEIIGRVTGYHTMRYLWNEHSLLRCMSPDGEQGHGEPGIECGRGCAGCKTYVRVYIDQMGESFPASILLPPNSVAQWHAFARSCPWLGGQLVAFRLVHHKESGRKVLREG